MTGALLLTVALNKQRGYPRKLLWFARERLQKIAGWKDDDDNIVGAVVPFFADWAFRAVSIQSPLKK